MSAVAAEVAVSPPPETIETVREKLRKQTDRARRQVLTIKRLRGRIRGQRQVLRSEGIRPTCNEVVRLKARVNRLLMVVAHQRAQRQGKSDADDLADELLYSLERDTEMYRRRWQRVLQAYLALRELRELPQEIDKLFRKARLPRKDGPLTTAIARLLEAEKQLLTNDLKVLT